MESKIIEMLVCHPEGLPDNIREELFSGQQNIAVSGDYLYIKPDQTVYRLPDNGMSRELAWSILQRGDETTARPQSISQLYRRILKDPQYQPDPALMREMRIKENAKYCVAVFRSYSALKTDLCSSIGAVAPLQSGDCVIPVDYQTAALIKSIKDAYHTDEMKEYAEALIDTMETEGFPDICAGIGRECKGTDGIRTSCSEGLQALGLGKRYHRQERVYIHEKQMLEKIVDAIPEEKKQMILQSFFGDKPLKALQDETMDTVRVFFSNDLNITAASKELFIHRNTMNYRLDKIRKDYGLDLRSFQDAVIFRIITEIANEK